MKNKIIFNDNLTLKTYQDGQITEYSCEFFEKYSNTLEKLSKSQEWKYQGSGAVFRGDVQNIEKVSLRNSYFNSVDATKDTNKAIFSVMVNDVSGIFFKDLSIKKDSEAHIIHSNEFSYSGSSLSSDEQSIATSIRNGLYTSHIAIYNLSTNDLISITDGDCFDFDATFSTTDSNSVLFATKGVGRDTNGEFVKYSPSSVCKYDLFFADVNEILVSKNYSFTKPKDDKNGNLYFIKQPVNTSKRGFGRMLLNLLLIPYRLLEAFICFLETFTMMFTGKGFSKNSNRRESAKTSNKRPDEIFIEGNLINVEKEYKNNIRHKDNYAGYAPRTWQLIKQDINGNQTVLINGVIDYDLLPDGSILYTNGKHVLIKNLDGKVQKIADTTMCTQVSCFK